MEIIFGHGKSAGMVCPDKALDPAHSDSHRLSLALFPGTFQAAAMAVKISEIHQLFVAELISTVFSIFRDSQIHQRYTTIGNWCSLVGHLIGLTYIHRCQMLSWSGLRL